MKYGFMVDSIHGVAVDQETDSIYVAGNDLLVKLSPDLRKLKEYAGFKFRDVDIVGEEIVACKFDSSCLEIFDKNLKKKRASIHSRSFGVLPNRQQELLRERLYQWCCARSEHQVRENHPLLSHAD